jgi:prolyl oligopeptidase
VSNQNQIDPYLWLEEVEAERSLDWVRSQNAVSRAELEARPEFETIRTRLLSILNSEARIPYLDKHGDHYYNFWHDAAHERGLWRRTTLESYRTENPDWETVLDVDALAKLEAENWVFGGAQHCVSDPGRALVRLSRGGADATVVREFNLVTKTFVTDGFNLSEAKSWFGWRDPDSIFVGTDFGPGSLTTSGYPRVVKIWNRGQALADAETTFEGQEEDMLSYGYHTEDAEFPREFVSRRMSFFTDETRLLSDGNLINIDKPESTTFGTWREFALLEPKMDWTLGDRTYTAGSLLAIKLEEFLNGSRNFDVLFEPSDRKSLQNYHGTKNFLLLNELENVRHSVYALEHKDGAWVRHKLETPEFGQIKVWAVDSHSSDAYWMDVTDYLTPSSLYHASGVGQTPERLKRLPAFFDASGLQTQQFEATSQDGTKIPYFMVSREDTVLDGSNPTLLYGYGGFEVSQLPQYSAGVGSSWLERGGVYVVANIRGGGEFGPRWHRAALREHRQRAYDDFIAVAEDLIARGVTSSDHLGIQGGSNGGLLMGVMLTERPDLWKAVVCQVPLLDMRRYHLLLAGASWMEEYGDPDKPDDWAFISRYSPYQNVREGVNYPRVLFTTSTRDDRVHPGHARKMFARMKEMGLDALYFENIEGGHGGAANNAQAAYMAALAYTFLLHELR